MTNSENKSFKKLEQAYTNWINNKISINELCKILNRYFNG